METIVETWEKSIFKDSIFLLVNTKFFDIFRDGKIFESGSNFSIWCKRIFQQIFYSG